MRAVILYDQFGQTLHAHTLGNNNNIYAVATLTTPLSARRRRDPPHSPYVALVYL